MSEPIVTFDEQAIRNDLRELVRQTVEDTLNGLLEEEADDLVGTERYERTAEREAYRAGHYDRKLVTTSGEVTVRMPKLEGMRLTTAAIERYRRRETGVGEAMVEMRLAGVPARRIEDVSEALRGAGASAATVSNLDERAFESVEAWRSRPPTRAYPYVYVDGCREAVGAAEGFAESPECRREFPSWLKSRGPRGARMFTGDKASGMVGAIAEVFPEAACRRRTARFYRNAFSKVPKPKRKPVAGKLEAIHAQESFDASGEKALRVADDLESMRLGEAAKVVRDGYAETLAYTRFPVEHWRRVRTNNAVERLNREIGRRTRVVGTFPDGKSALMLVTARLKYVADSEWGSRRYLDVTLLED